MAKVYVEPSVKLSGVDQSFYGFFLWMKSRQWIVEDSNGVKFMREGSLSWYSDGWFTSLPDQFKVGDETVKKDEYYDRIDRMNLQYNTCEVYSFEINGSCLFRDIIFNINRVAEWAQSNRFLFSILDGNAIFDEGNYHISAEYKGIPEWELQFDKYMTAIKDDQVVDHNRHQMPYSISSTFWITIDKKTLIDLLSFLYHYAPFFYDVYGKQFMEIIAVPESQLAIDIPASIKQYLSEGEFKEGITNIKGLDIVQSRMGLILYSQFIRQKDTTISGLLDIIMHNDAEEFSHKVFKGDTKLEVTCIASRAKMLSTVSTRLCAFAMSSGDDICSWNYFLKNYIPKDITLTDFAKMLPCTIKSNKLLNCKFYDDVKFRNEGKEVSNCPCPLITRSMKDAQRKKNRDNNLIGDKFYMLTKSLLYDGLTSEYEATWWTSKLVIRTEKDLTDNLLQALKKLLYEIEKAYLEGPSNLMQWLPNWVEGYSLNGDPTCAMKGWFIDKAASLLNQSQYYRFIIDFGGDLYVQFASVPVSIEGTKFTIMTERCHTYSICTSGNTAKRGHHIEGGYDHEMVVSMIKDGQDSELNMKNDIYATKLMAYENLDGIKFIDRDFNPQYIRFTEDGKVISGTYCASPFFNEKQIAVRDRMVERFLKPFRPDLTDSSKKFDAGDNSVVKRVVMDNIVGIESSVALVFPKHTNDLGTLFEVGHALKEGLPIIAYDDVRDQYFITIPNRYSLEVNDDMKVLFNCSDKSQVVSLGYSYGTIEDGNIYYQLKGCPDNIMLSVLFNHVEETENGTYEILKRDENDRDK